MPTLQEFLALEDFGQAKTASSRAAATDDDAELNKLAAQLGLDLAFDKEASEESKEEKEESKEEKHEEEAASPGQHKKASIAGIGGLYSALHPDDFLGGVKTAGEEELTKEASTEMAMGERAREYADMRSDERLLKLAYSVLAKGTTTHHDSQHPGHMDNDRAQRDNGGKPIGNERYTANEMIPEKDDAVVGHEEWATGHNTIDNPRGVTKKASLALIKHQILAQLEG